MAFQDVSAASVRSELGVGGETATVKKQCVRPQTVNKMLGLLNLAPVG
jgi:hypothetical protein